MRQVLRVVLATVLGAVLVATAVPAAGAAPSAPTIRVAPSRALQDGQTVAVFGSGFPPLGRLVGLAQCPAATPDDFSACIGHQLIHSVAGAYGTHFPVHRSVGSTDCAEAPGTCAIVASNLDGAPAFTQRAVARLRFGPPATVLQSTLIGWEEIGPDGAPGAGNLGAVGAATLAVGATSLCATLSVIGVHLPTVAAHVHEAGAGANGPIVITLRPPGPGGRSQACTEDGVDPVLLARLASQPTQFYVNVHTRTFPNGGVRGQLARADAEGPMLAARLSGLNEITSDGRPLRPADERARGIATFTADVEAGRLCYELSVRGLLLPTFAAHIHSAPAGLNGEVVVPLAAPDETGRAAGCVDELDGLVRDITIDPGYLYVNVHLTGYGQGKTRGQLAPAAALAG